MLWVGRHANERWTIILPCRDIPTSQNYNSLQYFWAQRMHVSPNSKTKKQMIVDPSNCTDVCRKGGDKDEEEVENKSEATKRLSCVGREPSSQVEVLNEICECRSEGVGSNRMVCSWREILPKCGGLGVGPLWLSLKWSPGNVLGRCLE